MGNTALTAGGYTFIFQTGDVHKIEEKIESKSEQQELAASGPAGALLYDYDGSIKVIIITGVLTTAETTRISGYTITTVLSQKQWLESLINGSQSEITLTDDYAGQSVLGTDGATPPFLGTFTTTKAYEGSITFSRVKGKPGQMAFSITLKVGNV